MAILPYITRGLIWIGDSKDSLSGFPAATRKVMGVALRLVQNGETPKIAKPLTDYGSGVFELKDNEDTNAYRVVYVVKLKKGVYVLDAFMKKSKSGRAIPKEIKERLKTRLKCAKEQDKG